MGREGQEKYGALGIFLFTALQFCCYYYCFARFCASEIFAGIAISLLFIIFLASSHLQRTSRPWFISFLHTYKVGHSMRGMEPSFGNTAQTSNDDIPRRITNLGVDKDVCRLV